MKPTKLEKENPVLNCVGIKDIKKTSKQEEFEDLMSEQDALDATFKKQMIILIVAAIILIPFFEWLSRA